MNAIDFFKKEDPGNNESYSKDMENWFYDKNDMVQFAEKYHQAKLKLLGIADVVGRSEQLTCDCVNNRVKSNIQDFCGKCGTTLL